MPTSRLPLHWTLPIGLLLLMAGATQGQTTVTMPVTFDRWMYPFNATPGARVVGSTFGAVGETIFDDLDAQLLLGFSTEQLAPPALTQDPNFRLLQATVHLTTATDRAFVLDTSADSIGSYVDPTTDSDPGRPIMLMGVGTRGGYQNLGLGAGESGPPIFHETDPFGRPGPPAAQIRNAFASDDGVRDASNFVREQLAIQPWAIAQSDSVPAGSEVPLDTALAFQLDLQNDSVLNQIKNDLRDGAVFVSVVSLHSATAGSNVGVPTFYLGDLNQNHTGARATLSLTYQVVPEPGLGAATGLFGLALWNGKRRRLAAAL